MVLPVRRVHGRQGLNALMLEDVSGGDEQPCLARSANQLYRADTVAPKLKEVVLDPDPWEAKGLGKERAEDLFLGRARSTPVPLVAPKSGAGSPLRSSLPLGVSGRALSRTIAAGTCSRAGFDQGERAG